MKKPICTRVVNENIRRVELGMPLTRSLRVLNTSCEFKKKFDEMDKIRHEEEIKEEKNKSSREYRKRPEVKEHGRRYNKLPKVARRKRRYNKKRYRKMRDNPKVWKNHLEQWKKYYQENRDKIRAKQKERYERLKPLSNAQKIQSQTKSKSKGLLTTTTTI